MNSAESLEGGAIHTSSISITFVLKSAMVSIGMSPLKFLEMSVCSTILNYVRQSATFRVMVQSCGRQSGERNRCLVAYLSSGI